MTMKMLLDTPAAEADGSMPIAMRFAGGSGKVNLAGLETAIPVPRSSR